MLFLLLLVDNKSVERLRIIKNRTVLDGRLLNIPREGLEAADLEYLIELDNRSKKPDIRIAANRFLKGLMRTIAPQFLGIYLDPKYSMSLELDSTTGNLIDDRTAELTSELETLKKGSIIINESNQRLALPLQYRTKKYGLLVVDKPEFSDRETRLVIAANNLFGSTARMALQIQKLEKEVLTDHLTGIGNRRKFEMDYMQIKHDSERTGKPFSLALVDLDNFKKVNDTYGHPYGDDVLREVCKILKLNLRVTDILDRYGGEEFVMLMPDTNLEEGEFVCQRVTQGVREHVFKNSLAPELAILKYDGKHDSHSICISVGVASSEKKSGNRTEKRILEDADLNLYRAKGFGRDRVFSGNEYASLEELANLPLLNSALKRELRKTRRTINNNLALYCLDVVQFSKYVSELGEDAWQSFNTLAHTVFGMKDQFVYVARFGDSDKILILDSNVGDMQKYQEHVELVGSKILSTVRSLELSNTNGHNRTGKDAYFDVAQGILLYDPQAQSRFTNEQVIRNPELLIDAANKAAKEAGSCENRMIVRQYRNT